jgi:hypothetical protein
MATRTPQGYLPINLRNVESAPQPLSPGAYQFEIGGTEVRTNANGEGQRLLVRNLVIRGPDGSRENQGRTVYNSYQLSEKGMPYVRRLFEVCRVLTKDGRAELDELIGRRYSGRIIAQGLYMNITAEGPLRIPKANPSWSTLVALLRLERSTPERESFTAREIQQHRGGRIEETRKHLKRLGADGLVDRVGRAGSAFLYHSAEEAPSEGTCATLLESSSFDLEEAKDGQYLFTARFVPMSEEDFQILADLLRKRASPWLEPPPI